MRWVRQALIVKELLAEYLHSTQRKAN